MVNMDELKDIIVYLVYNCRWPHLPEFNVQKLIFLTEIESYKTTGKRLTDANYKSYNYGPYSEDVQRAYESLEDDPRVTVAYHRSMMSKRVYKGAGRGQAQPTFPTLDENKLSILEKISTEWGTKTGNFMAEHIYRTYIYASTPFDHYYEFERIPQNLIDKKIREDEVADGEALKAEILRYAHLESIKPPQSARETANAGDRG